MTTSKVINIKEKDRFVLHSGTSYIRVMAVKEGYIMARWCGCYPFVKSIDEFNLFVKDLIYTPYNQLKNKQQQ